MLQLPNAAHAHAKEAAGNKNMNCSNSSHVKPTKDLKHSNANKKMAARKKFHVADKNRTWSSETALWRILICSNTSRFWGSAKVARLTFELPPSSDHLETSALRKGASLMRSGKALNSRLWNTGGRTADDCPKKAETCDRKYRAYNCKTIFVWGCILENGHDNVRQKINTCRRCTALFEQTHLSG